MHILVIEDNPEILKNIYGFFEPLGYTLDSALNGFAGLAQAAEGDYDVIILDVLLPGLDGFQLCHRLRKELRIKTPVLMLTARDTIEDRVEGFDNGADDYLIKPFSFIELDARLKALIRRSRDQYFKGTLSLGPLLVDPENHEVLREGVHIELTPTGHKLLRMLLHESPNVVKKRTLEHEIWGDNMPNSDALKTHIHTLRQALDKPFNQPMLKTVPSIGYRLVKPDE